MFENDDEFYRRGSSTSKVTTDNHPFDRLTQNITPTIAKAPNSALDSEEVKELKNRLLSLYMTELEIQSENRAQMEEDEAFYDNEQWSEEDKAVLASRGQLALTFNVCATSVNWMLGTERRGRTDYRLLPRREEGSKAAEAKTGLLKYLADVNRSEFHISRSFAECVKAGVGWIESGVQEATEGEPIYDRYESWRNIIHDSAATELDLSDGRYQFRHKWVDYDRAKAIFHDRQTVLEMSRSHVYDYGFFLDDYGDEAMDGGERLRQNASGSPTIDNDLSYTRNRVRLIEAWFTVPVVAQRVAGGQFAGELYDPMSPGHQGDVITGRATVKSGVIERMHVMILTPAGVLWFSKSPFRHNRYPFTPIWCYQNAKTNLPYGVVRAMKSAQQDLNKRASKALHILSTSKVIADDDAVADWEEFQEEVNRPDAIIRKKRGTELRIDVDRGLAAGHVDLMSRDISMIQQITGVTDENMGRTTNATSGKAIIARQEQGGLATAPIFDNLRFARQVHGEKMLSLVEQYMRDEKVFYLTNSRGNREFKTVNDGMPENDIIRTKADFVISEDDFNATLRQSQAQEFMELLSTLASTNPDVVIAMLDLLVEMLDTPNRDEVVKRVRAINGQKDPDADPNAPPDPEEAARQQAMAAQQALNERAANAEIATKEATAAEKTARAKKTLAEIQSYASKATSQELDSFNQAFELALKLVASPAAADSADQLLTEARAEASTAGKDANPAPAEPTAIEADPTMQQAPEASPGLPAPVA